LPFRFASKFKHFGLLAMEQWQEKTMVPQFAEKSLVIKVLAGTAAATESYL